MTRRIHALCLKLEFPSGIAPGEGGDYNILTIAKNGKGQPVLRGTSLAGALRHAYGKYLRRAQRLKAVEADQQVKQYFGYALGDGESAGGIESPLQVSNSILHTGSSGLVARTYHLRNRHTGAVADGGLFSLESCPPGTTATVAIWLRDDGESPDTAVDFLRTLVGLLQGGITLGGKSARGIGLARLRETPSHRTYDLTDLQAHAAWLDDYRAWRQDLKVIPAGQPLAARPKANATLLRVDFSLGIPRGQDVLVGDGQGLDHEIEPQRVLHANGKYYWRLPGASLRGLFRGWVARLAARENRGLADNVQRHQACQRRVWKGELLASTDSYYGDERDELSGDNLGWCFLPKEDRRQERAKTGCPVAGLFGSLFQAGRIHISDAYAVCSSSKPGDDRLEEQLRKHVAVDRVTGGAAEGMLFENTVLTWHPKRGSPRFAVQMQVEDPTEEEARWLAQTLRALDLGVLRVGSSKSSGRLALMAPPQATGPRADHFAAIQPACLPEDFAVMVQG